MGYIYIYIAIYICIYVYIYICIHGYMDIWIYGYMDLHGMIFRLRQWIIPGKFEYPHRKTHK